MSTRTRKLLVCDLDGVLVQSDGTIREGDLNTIKQFINEGGMFVACTGRLDQDIQYVEEQIGVKGSFRISQNGSVIKNKEDEIIFHKTVDPSYIDTLNDILSRYDVRTEINDVNNRYFPSPRNPEEVAEFIDTSIVKENLFEFAKAQLEPTIYLNFGDASKFTQIKNEIEEVLGNKVTVSQTSESSLEIFSNEASKGNAVKFISSKLDIPKENILAAGDAQSDITMFPHVGTSYAVSENSDQKVRDAADHFVMTIEEILTEYA